MLVDICVLESCLLMACGARGDDQVVNGADLVEELPNSVSILEIKNVATDAVLQIQLSLEEWFCKQPLNCSINSRQRRGRDENVVRKRQQRCFRHRVTDTGRTADDEYLLPLESSHG